LTIDYNHNPDEVVGYLNNFDIDSGDLLAAGALTPFTPEDRASELIFKMGEGVPYEASINFSDSMVLEEIEEDEEVTVNNRDFVGPLTVVREWGLRNIAVCPMGADKNTESTLFNEGKDIVVKFITKGEPKMKTELTVDAEAVEETAVDTEVVEEAATEVATDATPVEDKPEGESVEQEAPVETQEVPAEKQEAEDEEATVDDDTAVLEPVSTEAEAPVESEAESKPLSVDKQEFKQMVAEFGKDLAIEFFVADIPLGAAREKHYSHIKQENAELKQQIEALKTQLAQLKGDDSPTVEFIAEAQGIVTDPRYKELAATLGPDLAKFIAGRPKH
jgi:hypothetical protein